MNKGHRWLGILVIVLMPAMSAMAQSTPVVTSGEPTPFAQGLNAPATYVDIRGNPVLSIAITSIERDWQEYDEYSAPETGKEYVVVNVAVTNLTARAATISPFSVIMLDSLGTQMDQGYLYEESDFWVDDVSIPAGETVDGAFLYLMYSDLEPMMLMWQPDYGSWVMVYLSDDLD